MNAKRRSAEIQYADRILGVLNRVELLRQSACTDFSSTEKAARIWRTAEAIEEAIIRENALPDVDAILHEIMDLADAGSGSTGGDVLVRSYVQSARALAQILLYLRDAVSPRLKLLLDLIWADGHTVSYGWDCHPTRQMVEWQPPAETQPLPESGPDQTSQEGGAA